MIFKKTEAEILRFYFAEGWPIGTIAPHLLVHHSVVERVIFREEAEMAGKRRAV